MNAGALLFATLSIFRMGGDIRIDDAPNGAALRTMGGDIRVVHGAGRILARTMGGNIEIEHLDGSTLATTMGGNVTVNVDGGRDVELFSMGGEIEVKLPRGFSGEFAIELEEGDNGERHEIKSDFPLQITKTDRWHFFGGTRRVLTGTGRSGSGANRVKISTIGGDITIRQK